jgi:putative ABC transport system permease protein
MWTKPLQAVVGAQAARAMHLKPGDKFVGAHGLSGGGEMHSQFPYTVVGILASTGSVLDRLILCDIQTVRYIHKMHAEDEAAETGVAETYLNLPDAATAVIASFKSPVAAMLVPRLIDANPMLSAASPSFEIARLMSYLRPLTYAAVALGVLLVAIATAGAAAALMATMNTRTRDLALLRALGAHPFSLALVAFWEAGVIAAGALILGLALGWIILAAGRAWLMQQTGLLVMPTLEPTVVLYLVGGAVFVSLIAALVPAIRAANTQIEEVLQS